MSARRSHVASARAIVGDSLSVIQAPIFTIIILYFFAIVEGKGAGFASKQVGPANMPT